MILFKHILNRIKTKSVKTVIFPQLVWYSTSHMNSLKQDKLYIRHESDSEHFQATFNWNCKILNIEREFNFNRKINEKLEDFVGRIKTNVEKVVCNKVKKKKKTSPETVSEIDGNITVNMYSESSDIPLDMTCEDIFFGDAFNPNKLFLKVMDSSYEVVVNTPWIVRLVLPTSIMAGFPIYPTIDIKFGNKYDSNLIWYRKCKENNDWIETGKGLIYTPSTGEIGQKLKLCCIPGNGKTFGPQITVEADAEIEAGPGLCPFNTRHSFTKETLPLDRFRVVSYNILADVYAETEVARTELFPYCPPYAICLDYRKQLYLQEIIGYNGDIICLQEVDVKVFENELKDILGLHKLNGVLTRKGTTVSEGVATFYSTQKFRLVEAKISELGDEIDVNPIYKSIWAKIKGNENLRQRFKERNTVLQVLVFESLFNPKQKIIVGNTHLFFHPNADHIRLLQAGMILCFIEDIFKNLIRKSPSDNISLIICGDFNSTPDSGIYRLMTTNSVPTNIIDWTSTPGEEVEGLELKHSFSIDSACGTPKYTNFTSGFSGCLDYIYYQKDKLNVLQVVPFPDEELLKTDVAIPSVTFPSDHIALVADFDWKS